MPSPVILAAVAFVCCICLAVGIYFATKGGDSQAPAPIPAGGASGGAAAAPAVPAGMITGKIVRVERADNKAEAINLLGIDVFDQSGAKITATATLGPKTYANNPAKFGPQFLVDGVHAESGPPEGLRLPHTEADVSSFMQLDLGSDKVISKIVIYNRTACCMDRINGCVLKVMNAAGATIVTIPLSGSKAVYTFSAPLTNTSTTSTYMPEPLGYDKSESEN